MTEDFPKLMAISKPQTQNTMNNKRDEQINAPKSHLEIPYSEYRRAMIEKECLAGREGDNTTPYPQKTENQQCDLIRIHATRNRVKYSKNWEE